MLIKFLDGHKSDHEDDDHQRLLAKNDHHHQQQQPQQKEKEPYSISNNKILWSIVIVIILILLLFSLFEVFRYYYSFNNEDINRNELKILFKILKQFSTSTLTTKSILFVNYICKKLDHFNTLYVNKDIDNQIETNKAKSLIYSDLILKNLTANNHNQKKRCTHYSCFDLYRCGLINYNLQSNNNNNNLMKQSVQEHIKVFIYPNYKFKNIDNRNTDDNDDDDDVDVDIETKSIEYERILNAIRNSHYYINNSNDACLFIPQIDILNMNNVNNLTELELKLSSLPLFQHLNGNNHLLFVQLNQKYYWKENLLENFPQIMLANGMFSDRTYRLNFDISIPFYSLFSQLYESIDHFNQLPFKINELNKLKRKWTIVSTQLNQISKLNQKLLLRLESFYSNRMILVDFNSCKQPVKLSVKNKSNSKLPFWSYRNETRKEIWKSYKQTIVCNNDRHFSDRYLDLLHNSKYCLILPSRNYSIGQLLLSDIMMSGCIPVIIDDNFVLPFQERIDWTTISIRVRERSINNLFEIIDSNLKTKRMKQLRLNVLNIWNMYFRNIENITLSTLDIINERVYPKRKNIQKNLDDNNQFRELIPLSLEYFSNGFNYISPKNLNLLSDGFTAVVLTYNRLDSLYHVVASLSNVPSCRKILIIWNNQQMRPPPNEQWSSISSTPIQIIRAKQNKLSNRFYPYSSIETEAIFAIDDDITMLNLDEIEFSYQTWSEFPDRIVGFPSRLHLWNNLTNSWIYDSEWKNKISLILTGAAFYHNYYNYLYTFVMPSTIRKWVDDNMNCEDIAMNFLVSNITGKAPIKVTPRKKFKCPECVRSSNSLSDDVLHHLQLRSNCVDYFSKIYRMMPLKAVEFRSDPVLFRDNIPEKFKHFSLIGNL